MERSSPSPPGINLADRFAGCLLGGLLGDVIGAVVEGESPGYIRKTYASVDAMLAQDRVEEILGQHWLVGRFTDDTCMTIAVAEWLRDDPTWGGKTLLAGFAERYRPARRYGSGTAHILQAFPEHAAEWKALATLMFPDGSFGNGAAMRVAPIGCRLHDEVTLRRQVVRTASVTTHAHSLAVIGATLQATAVAQAVTPGGAWQVETVLQALDQDLNYFDGNAQDVTVYRNAVAVMRQGLAQQTSPADLRDTLGTGIAAHESVPMAIYCALRHSEDYEQTIHEAVFLGGDTDTIASMAGAVVGAHLGTVALPRRWLARVREEHDTPGRIQRLAHSLAQCSEAE
jgi:poly(ADP-ribose) glycohydrolase ARH3